MNVLMLEDEIAANGRRSTVASEHIQKGLKSKDSVLEETIKKSEINRGFLDIITRLGSSNILGRELGIPSDKISYDENGEMKGVGNGHGDTAPTLTMREAREEMYKRMAVVREMLQAAHPDAGEKAIDEKIDEALNELARSGKAIVPGFGHECGIERRNQVFRTNT